MTNKTNTYFIYQSNSPYGFTCTAELSTYRRVWYDSIEVDETDVERTLKNIIRLFNGDCAVNRGRQITTGDIITIAHVGKYMVLPYYDFKLIKSLNNLSTM